VVAGSAFSTMSISDGLIARSSSGYSPVTVCRKMLSGIRMPSSSANFIAGMTLPRAMPAMSGTTASTSEMPCSLKNCWIGVLMTRYFRALTRERAASPKAANIARENEFFMTCHWVPLHREREAGGRPHPERFDQAVPGMRLDLGSRPSWRTP
jgi:hypothetical protein